MPRSSAASSTSFSSTGMPALAYAIAMPPPIVPAPTTAARVMSIAGVSCGMSGTFAASRSAKKRWRSARDSVGQDAVGEQLALARRSRRRNRASSRPRSRRRPRRARARPGLSGPAPARVCLHTRPRPASRSAILFARSRVRRGATPARATFVANAIAPVKQVAVDDESTMPAAARERPRPACRPCTSRARGAAPHSRGRRCVPPAPGMMPSSTSGWPTLASGTATR